MTIWVSKWIRESKSRLCAFSWRRSQRYGGNETDPIRWLKAGIQASIWPGVRVLFSFHKLISQWIWIISALRRQNPVCGSLFYSSKPVSLQIIFSFTSLSAHFASLHIFCAVTHKRLFLLRSVHWSCSFPVSIKSSLCSAFLIWSPDFCSKPSQLIGHKIPLHFYGNHLLL